MNASEVVKGTPKVLKIPAIDEQIKMEVMKTGLYTCTQTITEEEADNKILLSSPVSTNNWDTVTIVRGNCFNDDIAAKGTYPKAIDFTIVDEEVNSTEYAIHGTFKPWAITTGGEGRNIWFSLKWKEGTFINAGKSMTLPEDTEAVISVILSYFPLPAAQAKNGEYKLSVDASEGSADTAPCVSVMSVDTKGALQPIAETVFASILGQWLNKAETLALFQPLFATVVVDNGTDENFAWLKPTYMSYAYRDAARLEDSFFGVLCMTNNRDGGEGIKQLPLVSMGQSENVVLLINREIFVKYQYLPSLPLAVPNTTSENYTLGSDGITVSASGIKLSKVAYGSMDYQPVLKNFVVSFDEARVRTILQVDINISPGIDVHSFVETEHTFALGYNEKKEPIMIYKNIGEPLVRNEVEASAGIIITEVILDIIVAVVSAGLVEAVEKVTTKIIIALVAAIVVAAVAIIIHLIIEEVVTDGTLEKLPSVTPMMEAGVSPVQWPFTKTGTFKAAKIIYNGAFIFVGKEG